VAVYDDDGAGNEQGFHGFGLIGVKEDADVTLPVGALGSGAGAVVSQAGGGELEEVGAFDLDAGLMDDGGGGGDGDGDCVRGAETLAAIARRFKGNDLLDGDVLRGEDAVEAFEGEEAAAVEDVGDVRLTESGLAGEKRTSEHSALDAAEKFQAKIFVHVAKVHEYVC